MSFARVGVVTFAAAAGLLRCGVIDAEVGCTIWGLGSSPAKVVKVDNATFAEGSTLTFTFPLANSALSGVLYPSAHKSLWGCYSVTHPVCVRVNNYDLTEDGGLDFRAGTYSAGPNRVALCGPAAYFCMSTSPGDIYKIQCDPLVNGGYKSLDTGENNIQGASSDVVHGCVYVGTLTSPCYLVKIDLSSFSRVGALAMPFNNVGAVECDQSGTYVYVSSRESPARVTRVRISDFTIVNTISLNAGEADCECMLCDEQSDNLYCACLMSPGKVVRVRVSDFTRQAVVTFNTGENQPKALCIDIMKSVMYAGCYTNPGKVVKMSVDVILPDHMPVVGLG